MTTSTDSADNLSSPTGVNALIPVAINKKSNTEMVIDWSNGQQTVFPFVDLRYFCRCAECVDEWTRQRKLERKNIKPDIKPLSLELVGRYAIQIAWSDGHRAGIYPFELLYEIATGQGK